MSFIVVKNVCFSYIKNQPVLHNINISLEQKECTVIRGENGSGKTTLGKLIASILPPLKGNVFIGGKCTSSLSLSDIGKQIGYLFQNPERQLFAATVYDELSFALDFNGIDKHYIDTAVTALLKKIELYHLKDVFPYHLSYGEKKRLAIASLLINKPQYLILDEPTTGLDSLRKSILSDFLSDLLQEGIGMAVITHDQSFIKKHAQRIITLSGGEVFEDYRLQS